MTWKKFSEEKPWQGSLIIVRQTGTDGSKEHDIGIVEDGIFLGIHEQIALEGLQDDDEWQEVQE